MMRSIKVLRLKSRIPDLAYRRVRRKLGGRLLSEQPVE